MEEHQPEPKKDAPDGTPDAAAIVQWCVSVLAATAWQSMGLIPNPDTRQIQRNFKDARLAIDSTAALVEVVKSHLSDKQRREVEALLTDLRVNFVEQQTRSTPSSQSREDSK